MARQKLPDDPAKAFVKLVEQAAHRHATYEVFTTFLELAYCALRNRWNKPHSPEWEEIEARYMRAMKPYAEHESRHAFPAMLALMPAGLDRYGDFLGHVAGELGTLNAYMGQFFTPYELCRLMAEISFNTDETKAAIASKGFITVLEPACGAGAMVLPLAEIIQRAGHRLEETLFVHATDLSEIAFKMAFLQFDFRGIAARVVRGNTLSGEVFEIAYTAAARFFHAKHGHLGHPKEKPPARARRVPAIFRKPARARKPPRSDTNV